MPSFEFTESSPVISLNVLPGKGLMGNRLGREFQARALGELQINVISAPCRLISEPSGSHG